ncbi:hypothetical protein [Streptococcus uberis]|uniref:hypothetical protein n=1 Tax=Streptococcus uberis TaxID=1349 RepID=UPI003D35F73F
MKNFYVSGRIARLDLGAEVSAENVYMAPVVFKETYNRLLDFGSHELLILGVEEVN